MPLYKKSKEENKKTVWKIVGCEYCLFVDDERVYAENFYAVTGLL